MPKLFGELFPKVYDIGEPLRGYLQEKSASGIASLGIIPFIFPVFLMNPSEFKGTVTISTSRKTYYDEYDATITQAAGQTEIFDRSGEGSAELQILLQAVSDDDIAIWLEIDDTYQITAVDLSKIRLRTMYLSTTITYANMPFMFPYYNTTTKFYSFATRPIHFLTRFRFFIRNDDALANLGVDGFCKFDMVE